MPFYPLKTAQTHLGSCFRKGEDNAFKFNEKHLGSCFRKNVSLIILQQQSSLIPLNGVGYMNQIGSLFVYPT